MRRVSFPAVIFAVALLLGGEPLGFAQQLRSTEVVGGPGGEAFSDFEPPSGARVLEVRIRSGGQVDSVQMLYELPDGPTVTGPRHGGTGGVLNIFRLDADEYLVGISGRSGDYIDSIRFHTNKRTSPLFGGRGGSRDFRIDAPAGNQAVGLAGRAGDYLDAVGLAFTPIRAPVQISQTTIAGGRGGSAFSDLEIPPGARIAEVRVQAGDRVDAVRAVYTLPDGRLLEGARHGGRGGSVGIFHLDPDEYILGLSGRCGDYIDSVRIHTNKRTSQIFGGRGGNSDFRIDIPAGTRAVGFAGRAGDYLDAIGLTYTATGTPSRGLPSRRPSRPPDQH